MNFASPVPAAEHFPKAERPDTGRWGPWATIGWSIPIVVMMILSQSAGAIVYLRWWRFLHPEHPIAFSAIASNGAVLAVAIGVSAPIVLAFLVFVIRLSHQPVKEYLALRFPRWRDIGLGASLLALVLMGTGVIAGLAGKETPAFIGDTFDTARDAGMLWLLVVSFVFLGPLQEEALFRGFLFRGFAPRFGIWPTIVVTSAVWAVTHAQYEWFFVGEIFALGIAFGWLRARSGSLLLTFGLHATVNAMAVIEAAFMAGS